MEGDGNFMKNHHYWRFMPIIFLVFVVGFLVFANIQKPRLLVLHSYDNHYAWSRDVSTGVQRILEKYPHYSVQWHFMDTKRHNNKRFIRAASKAAIDTINRWQPNVVIAIDDNAQKYVIKKFINDPDINIVFSGVNAAPENYGYEKASNVTGILERIPLSAVKKSLLNILPKKTRRIAHITDASNTAEFVNKEVRDYDWEPFKFVVKAMAVTFDDWKQAVMEANKTADILLFTNYHTVRRSVDDARKVPAKELMNWTMKNTTIPGIGCWGFFVEDGGMLSVGISPFEQGEVAARMAVDIIEKGKLPSEIPMQSTKQFIIYAREKSLKASNLKLPHVYETFARATHNYY